MPWMTRWAGGFPVFAAEAEGARFRDVDGHEYVDFCLGDTAAMTGHSPGPTVRAHRRAGAPRDHADAAERGRDLGRAELGRRFGLPRWQFALTATDANRFAIRLARELTERPKILVFNWCYHGSVDETFATLEDGSVTCARRATSARRCRSPRPRAWSSGTTREALEPSSPTATLRAFSPSPP